MPGTSRSLLFSILLLLSACQNTASVHHAIQKQALQQVHTVTLNREFTIRADRASEYIQDGEIRPYDKISEYYPHCIFGLQEITASVHTIRPDTFRVRRVYQDQFVRGFMKVMVAAGDGDYDYIMSMTHFYLHSEHQPEVFRLSCQQLDASFEARQPTLEEMQQTLGDLFTLVGADSQQQAPGS